MIEDLYEVEWLLRWWAMGFDLEVHDWDYLRFLITLFGYFCENDPVAFMEMFPVLDEDIMADPLEDLEFITLDDEDEGVPLGLPRGLYHVLLPRQHAAIQYGQALPYGGSLQRAAPFGLANAPALFRNM
ncbi:hypothetical protein GOP47_0027393 [Adiantum capillus-veneris]|nr:hypothetical protein GOP47_0027393 [Adiantum capillus-veneris]